MEELSRVLITGINEVTRNVVDSWISHGSLPELDRLVKKGSWVSWAHTL